MSYHTHNHKRGTLSWFADNTVALFNSTMNGPTKRYRVPFSERRALLAGGDIALLFLSIWSAFLLWGRADSGIIEGVNQHMQQSWYWFPVLLFGWWALAWLNDLYDIPSSYDKALSIMRIALVAAISLCIYLFAFFLTPETLPRIFFLNFLFFSTVAISLWRVTYVSLSRLLPIYHRVLILGRGERANTIVDALEGAAELNYLIVGQVDTAAHATEGNTGGNTGGDTGGDTGDESTFIVDQKSSAPFDKLTTTPHLKEQVRRPGSVQEWDKSLLENYPENELPIVGRVDHLTQLAEQLHIHEVVVAMEQSLDRVTLQHLVDCQSNGIHVSWMPDLYEKLFRQIPIQHVDPAWVLQAMQNQPLFSRLQLTLKRLFDLLLIFSVIPVLLTLLPLVALAIRLDSPGPIFYRQTRCGRAGKLFTIYKFRTMTDGAEKAGSPQWATHDDKRVTPIGRILRMARIDELPQLLNILRGEMSIVGPRPERPEFVEMLEREIPYYRTRLMVKPGLTGWAQVHYDYGNSVQDALVKLQYDLYYVRYWSILLDIYTMFQTFAVVFQLKGM